MSQASRRARASEAGDYFEQARRPLACLVFLLPLVGLYELATAVIHPGAAMNQPGRVVAFYLLEWFFAILGATSLYLPGLAVVAILLAWHVLRADPWQLQPGTPIGMAAESVILAGPLLILSRLVAVGPAGPLQSSAWLDELILSVGAGIYEELVFRLILISLLAMVFIDLAGLRRPTGYALAILISSGLFAMHHYLPLGSEGFEVGSFAFRTAAGIYLAGVFVLRGFGIAAGCHAAYDLILVSLRAWA